MRRTALLLVSALLAPSLFAQIGAQVTSRLANLSVRTNAAAGQTVIVGFTLSPGSKQVLLRAVGPGLAPFGLSDTLADPLIVVYDPQGRRAGENDDWTNLAGTFTAVGAFPLPAGSRDAALITQLIGGQSQTAHIPASSNGLVLIEAYDVTDTYTPRLTNVSVRNRVGTGANILISGFAITGTGTKRLLLRGIGPGLAVFGVTGVLTDPRLVLHRSGDNGASTFVADNDDWSSSLAGTFATVGAFNLTSGSKDAALLVTLNPGTYTVQLSGVGDTTGEALIEAYEVP